MFEGGSGKEGRRYWGGGVIVILGWGRRMRVWGVRQVPPFLTWLERE